MPLAISGTHCPVIANGVRSNGNTVSFDETPA